MILGLGREQGDIQKMRAVPGSEGRYNSYVARAQQNKETQSDISLTQRCAPITLVGTDGVPVDGGGEYRYSPKMIFCVHFHSESHMQ